MKLLQESEDATNDRKLIKSQVEKRRRERMNRSLERLRTMLLQEPQQAGSRHRVEKAEILEHTVLFLQNTVKGDKTRAGGGGGTGGGGGGQKHTFQDGFSSCLQKAAHFLAPEGKGLWLKAALHASFAARFSRPAVHPTGVSTQPSSSQPHTKSVLRMLRQKSKIRQASRVNPTGHPYRFPAQQSFPRPPQQPQRQHEIRAQRPATKRSSPQSSPLSQTLWRPWS